MKSKEDTIRKQDGSGKYKNIKSMESLINNFLMDSQSLIDIATLYRIDHKIVVEVFEKRELSCSELFQV